MPFDASRHDGHRYARPLRILVVQDDQNQQSFLRSVLGRLGVHVALETVYMSRMADALKIVDAAKVDVVLSDSQLPDGSSANLFEHVLQKSPNADRILLTDPSDAGTPDDLALSGTQVWSKSQSIRELRDRIEHVLQVRALRGAGFGATFGGESPAP